MKYQEAKCRDCSWTYISPMIPSAQLPPGAEQLIDMNSQSHVFSWPNHVVELREVHKL